MPRGITYAGNVAPPTAPADYAAEVQTFSTRVASRFGVPLGLLGLSVASRAAASVTEHETQQFVTTMGNYQQVIQRCAARMMWLATARRCLVQIPVRVAFPLDTLLTLFETEIIDGQTMVKEAMRSYAIGDLDAPLTRGDGRSVLRSAYGPAGARLQKADGPVTFTKRKNVQPPPPEDEEEEEEGDKKARAPRARGR